MKQTLSSAPLWPILMGLMLGIVIGMTGVSAWLSLIAVVAAIACWLFVSDALCMVGIAIAVGWLSASINAPEKMPCGLADTMAYYRGEIDHISERESSRRVTVSISACGSDSCMLAECRPFRAVVYISSMFPRLAPGDSITLHTRMSIPLFSPDLPYESDYTRQLSAQGVVATAFVHAGQVTRCGASRSAYWRLRRVRTSLSDAILRSGLSAETAYFVDAVLLGDASLVPADVRRTFAAVGMAHMLALSGMHVSIIVVLLSVALLPLCLLRLNRWRVIVIVVVLWLYAVLTGLSPSVVRAVVMASVVLLGSLAWRRSRPLNNLCLAAILILVFDPYALTTVGFQLSFVAVGAILLLAPLLNPVDGRRRPLLSVVVSWIAVCVAAVIGTGMLSAYYFHAYPLWFLVGNMVAVILMPLLMGLSAVLLLLEMCGIDPLWLCRCIDGLYTLLADSADVAASLPGGSPAGLYIPGWTLVPYYAAVVALWLLLTKRRAIYACGLVAALVVLVVGVWVSSPIMPRMEYFVTRNAYRTDIVCRCDDRAYLLTTAPLSDVDGIVESCRHRYADYFGRAGVTSVEPIDSCRKGGGFSYRGDVFVAESDTCVVLRRNVMPQLAAKVRYALVCRGFTGDIVAVAAVADTVLLSRDIAVRRHDRYAAQLQAAGVPFVSLRRQAYRRVLR
jgi:ComEC/Rec2-related protein